MIHCIFIYQFFTCLATDFTVILKVFFDNQTNYGIPGKFNSKILHRPLNCNNTNKMCGYTHHLFIRTQFSRFIHSTLQSADYLLQNRYCVT